MLTDKIKELLENYQKELHRKLRDKYGVLVTTCCECGCIILTEQKNGELNCYNCLARIDLQDCADLWE